MAEAFSKNRGLNSDAKFHETVTKNDCKSFINSRKSYIVKKKKNDIQATVEVNKNILGALNSFGLKTGFSKDYKKALENPLNLISKTYPSRSYQRCSE